MGLKVKRSQINCGKIYIKKILKQVLKISKNLYTMLNQYPDDFTNENCDVGRTSWDTFKIELCKGILCSTFFISSTWY